MAKTEGAKDAPTPKKKTLKKRGVLWGDVPEVEALDQQAKKLEAEGLLAKVEPYEHNVAISDRSKSVIEPMVSGPSRSAASDSSVSRAVTILAADTM